MATLVRRLTRNSASLRTHLFPKPKPKPKPFPITYHNHLCPPKSECTDKVELLSPFFPSFPFGYCLNPIPQIGSEDEGTMWADSVKQKRKRKMNKHKLRKLRKSLRRKT